MKVYKLFHAESDCYMKSSGHFSGTGNAYALDDLVDIIKRSLDSYPDRIEEMKLLQIIEFENKTRTVFCTVRDMVSVLRERRINSLLSS